MRFGVSYGNHGDGIHVEDIVVYIRNALRAAGEEAYVLPTLLKDGINVILECFTPEQVEQLRYLKRTSGARFVIVASEFTDGTTFNSHIQSGEGHYVDKDYWKARFDNFMEAAKLADAIWSLSDFSVAQYQPLFPDKPVLPFPLGFDPFFAGCRHAPVKKKDIDLLFTGSETPHRKAVIDELSNYFYVLAAPVTTPTSARIDLISRAKATLHINLSEQQLHTSVMRHHFLIMNASSVVSERAIYPGILDDFIVQFDPADFALNVGQYLNSGQWKQAGVEAHARYRRQRPLAPAIKRLLADSLRA